VFQKPPLIDEASTIICTRPNFRAAPLFPNLDFNLCPTLTANWEPIYLSELAETGSRQIIHISIRGLGWTWLIHTCEITHYQTTIRHTSFIRVTCRLHMCDMTCSYVQHDSFTRVTWLIQAWPASGHDPLGPREPQVVYTHICIYLYLYRTLVYTQIYIYLYSNRTSWTLANFR